MAVGVGGYASGPLLRMAACKNIPSLIQEQNSYAGVTNRLLARSAAKICVAYPGMDKYFPGEKIVLTGNPVREELIIKISKENRLVSSFNIPPDKPVLLVLGGSLGARTVNSSIQDQIDAFEKDN